jgi:hypothetical protein
LSTSTDPVTGVVTNDASGKIKDTFNQPEDVETNLEIPEELEDFRKIWEEKINLPDDKKKAIIKAVNEIQIGAEKEKD